MSIRDTVWTPVHGGTKSNSINLLLHSINPSYLEIIIKVPFLPLFTDFPILFKAIRFCFKFSKSTEFRTLDRNATEDCIEGPGNLEGLFKLTMSLCILPSSNYSNLITNSFWPKEKYLTWPDFREWGSYESTDL